MSRRPIIAALLLALTALLAGIGVAPVAFAHKPSDSYLSLTPHGDGWNARWDIALRDLEYALGLDDDGDGAIRWGELRARERAVLDYALGYLTLRADATDCAVRTGPMQVVNHSDGAYAALNFAWDCPIGAQTLNYQLFFTLDPSHRGLLRVSTPNGVETVVLSPDQPQHALNAMPASGWRQFVSYWREGVWHIWIGFDHLLFLLVLLLPAVLWREHNRWRPVATLRPALLETTAVVTAFTLAHALTLTLAALDIVNLPSRLVESAIALTVVLAALNNLLPVAATRRWSLAFALGLIHGFGFASVLRGLGLPQDALVSALVGFNLGVETGQLAIVAVMLPLTFALRQTWLYQRLAFPLGSGTIALLALVWCLERGLNLNLIPTANATPILTALISYQLPF